MAIFSLISQLEQRLQLPLPGLEAQMRMGSRSRVDKVRHQQIPENAKVSAVLMLLYPVGQELHLPLILRTQYPGVHSGQVGLPGGRVEPQDPALMYTALRETEEEVGVPPHGIHVLGGLSPLYIPPSNFLVHPFVGFIPERPNFILDPKEVQMLIETKLSDFLDDANVGEAPVTVGGGFQLQVPRYLIQGHTVWGATAMMMAELVHILREIE